MHFSLEKEMQQVVTRKLPALLQFDRDLYAYGYEVPILSRIADVGFAPLRTTDFGTREAKALGKLRHRELLTLSYWLANGRPRKDLQSEALEAFMQSNLVKWRGKENRYSVSSWLKSAIGPLFMVEMKLTRWQTALEQALFYREVSDYSCVVVDSVILDQINTKIFSKVGVGLYSASKRKITSIVEPRKSVAKIPYLKYFYKLKVAASLSNSKKWEIVTG